MIFLIRYFELCDFQVNQPSSLIVSIQIKHLQFVSKKSNFVN